MKILLLCNNDLASLYAVNLLHQFLQKDQVILAQSSQVGGVQSLPAEIELLATYEKRLMADACSDKGVLPFAKSAQLTSVNKLKSFQQLADEYNHPLQIINHINQVEGIRWVSQLAPDLILSIRFGKILQQPIINIPKQGVINLHSGLLPEYQGIMATFWAMLNDANEIGCCLHYIQDKKIDAGDIIAQAPIKRDQAASYLQNLLAIYIPGVELIKSAIAQLRLGKILPSSKQQGKSDYYGYPDQSAMEQFLAKGYQLY